jgi:hypothetical protein
MEAQAAAEHAMFLDHDGALWALASLIVSGPDPTRSVGGKMLS